MNVLITCLCEDYTYFDAFYDSTSSLGYISHMEELDELGYREVSTDIGTQTVVHIMRKYCNND